MSQAQCQEVRKRKELELQILTEAIRSWEGDDITTLGNVVYMSQVMVQCAGSEVRRVRVTRCHAPLCRVGGNGTEWRDRVAAGLMVDLCPSPHCFS